MGKQGKPLAMVSIKKNRVGEHVKRQKQRLNPFQRIIFEIESDPRYYRESYEEKAKIANLVAKRKNAGGKDTYVYTAGTYKSSLEFMMGFNTITNGLNMNFIWKWFNLNGRDVFMQYADKCMSADAKAHDLRGLVKLPWEASNEYIKLHNLKEKSGRKKKEDREEDIKDPIDLGMEGYDETEND